MSTIFLKARKLRHVCSKTVVQIFHGIESNDVFEIHLSFSAQLSIDLCTMRTFLFITLLLFFITISTCQRRWRNRFLRRRNYFYEMQECDDLKRFMWRFRKNHAISDDCNDDDDDVAENFMINNITITEHNVRFGHGQETYTRALSEHSDLSYTQKCELRMGLNPNAMSRSLPIIPASPAVAVPTKVDWREGAGFYPIKNQANCGACWAFATISLVEFLMRRADMKNVLSEQNLIDCDLTQLGCSGRD